MNRRQFLNQSVKTLLLMINAKAAMSQAIEGTSMLPGHISLFLSGDVMTGRGIDQVLPHPGNPRLYEPYVKDARDYVVIAEQANGPIPKPVDFSYIWGDALKVLEHESPDVRIVNLETSITQSNEYWPGKGINYRMHPDNIPCITSAGIDCCVLANNHVLDWGYEGLKETLATLNKANIKTVGAGQNSRQASAPAVMEVAAKGRVMVFSFGVQSSGISWKWSATAKKSGINLLADLSTKTSQRIAQEVQALKRAGDIVVASIHWGGNWGYQIPPEYSRFAHALIDVAGVDIIHGHSSHHAKGIEVYKDKPIIYGCGDLLNDYEGIRGYEHFRDDLALMYFLRMDPATGKLVRLEMVPQQIRRFRLNRVSDKDASWLRDILDRECRRFGGRIELSSENSLVLYW
jgi:poly-gamma-glutamate synthesis protein (capsule biosynthesis protein)